MKGWGGKEGGSNFVATILLREVSQERGAALPRVSYLREPYYFPGGGGENPTFWGRDNGL